MSERSNSRTAETAKITMMKSGNSLKTNYPGRTRRNTKQKETSTGLDLMLTETDTSHLRKSIRGMRDVV
jgi:hypothetical protein